MDLPSDSDESDVDFVPQGEESSDGPSENEDTLENENGKSASPKKGKRPASSKAKTKSKRSRKDTDEECAPAEVEEIKTTNSAVDKKSEDDLWVSFLTDSPKDKKSEVETATSTETIAKIKDDSIDDTLNAKNTVKNKILGNRPAAGAKAGGLSSILNKIGKANKVSTLEKSKMDWINFKKDQDIEEEISTHNRGREGYLERQDFLQRTDLRQFEIEKNLRTNKRSNR